jgi:hypothetical protein
MDTRSGPDKRDTFVLVVFVELVTFIAGTVVVFTNGVNVFVGDTVVFTGSFFGWATHPVARIQPTAMRRVRSVIVFMGGSPF